MNSKRLKLVSTFLHPEDVFADIGCDHGILGLYAFERGIRKMQLIDNKEGPLQQAKANLAHLETQCHITYTLASGLRMLSPEVTAIAMCGMGGLLIIDLLEQDLERAKALNRLILQPNSHLFAVRSYLSMHHFSIVDEAIIKENNKIYEIIVAQYRDNHQTLSREDCYFGPVLRQNQSLEFKEKHQLRAQAIKQILNKAISKHRSEMLLNELQMINTEISKTQEKNNES